MSFLRHAGMILLLVLLASAGICQGAATKKGRAKAKSDDKLPPYYRDVLVCPAL